MTEKSAESTVRTSDKTQNCGDTISVLPILSEAKAPVSLTLTIDKSVSKIAGWVLGLIVTSSILVGAGIVMSVWMIRAYEQTEREVRLQRLEVDEMNVRLELAKIPKHKPGDSQ